MWLRPARLQARKCVYFTSFWQHCDTAPELLCPCLWCSPDLSSVSLGSVVVVGADWSSRGLLLSDWAQRRSSCVERWKTFWGCWFQARVLGLPVLRITKQGLYVNVESGGLCSKCQFSSNCQSITTPHVSETRCCILCIFCLAAWKALHRTADKLRTLMMGEQRAESSFDLLPVLMWGCWFTRVGPFLHEDSKKSQLIEGAVGTLWKRGLELIGKVDKGMGNWCSFFTDLETCYKNIWSSWTPHLYGFCQKLNAIVNSVRAQLSQQR